MSQDTNPFGGGNPRSLYVPLSEDEQEVISRIVESRDLHVHIVGWGVVHNPRATYGDLRVRIPIQITFDRPAAPVLVNELMLELRMGDGTLLFSKPYALDQPMAIGTGTTLAMVWDIAIQHMDPDLVRRLKPGATGLTSRLQDRDTKDVTIRGNMQLDPKQREQIVRLRKGEAATRAHDAEKLAKARRGPPDE